MTTETLDPKKIEEISDRAIGYLSGAAISALVYLGDQLGLYRALRGAGPVTSAELAAKSKLHERWVREWLHGQASAGLVRYAGEGRFELTGEQAAVLADEANPAFLPGGFALTFSLFQKWERLHESFRTGRGVSYNQLGADHAVAESRFSAPWMRANLVSVILPGLEGVTSKLAAGAKVADAGCGSGKALLEMAKAYPNSQFHGYDSSELAIRFAKEHLAASGLTNVTFHHAAANTLKPDASFDFILTWDCLHDMTNPAEAMRAIRKAIKPDGTWLIVDINGMPAPEENYNHPLGGLLYGFSVLDCLGCSTSADGGAGLGTLGLPEPVARRMTAEAGFTRFTVRDFGNPLNSFYEVRP
ncbi:methyltransferase domain-containing protein [candidate division KSB1 bacterium]|nr:methyltransferase domain-containing protein [candidate division KSB1 bacterium]